LYAFPFLAHMILGFYPNVSVPFLVIV